MYSPTHAFASAQLIIIVVFLHAHGRVYQILSYEKKMSFVSNVSHHHKTIFVTHAIREAYNLESVATSSQSAILLMLSIFSQPSLVTAWVG